MAGDKWEEGQIFFERATLKNFDDVFAELSTFARIRLTVRPENVVAIHLYRSVGFLVIEQRKNYYGDGETRLLLERKIK